MSAQLGIMFHVVWGEVSEWQEYQLDMRVRLEQPAKRNIIFTICKNKTRNDAAYNRTKEKKEKKCDVINKAVFKILDNEQISLNHAYICIQWTQK